MAKVKKTEENRVMSGEQFRVLLRFECYWRLQVKWEDIASSSNGYQAASEKIQAILAAKEKGVLVRRPKPENFYTKRREALDALKAQEELPF